ncbi:MAG: alpha/beta hydrolase [Chloroflexota bacterium]
MSVKIDNQIKLRDGRSLGYAEYGDLSGKPVLHFHGTPSSRFEGSRPVVGEIATRLHARIIVVERPGFGLSDFKPGRTIGDWPDDVNELADALNLDRFAVMGLSGGGPYVAACAYKIPQRLSAAGIISGVSPLDAPGAFDGMGKTDRQAFDLARKAPWLLRPIFWYMARESRKNPDKVIAQLVAEALEPDKTAMAQADVKETLIKMMNGAFQQGARGTAWEYVLFVRPWGFRLEDIRIPVYLWHGEMDTMCPINMGRYIARAIPDCRAEFFPQEGHISLIVNHYEELLRTVVS